MIWTLKPSAEKKFRDGHPWVMSRDLVSPFHARVGQPIELRSSKGEFLARGYGNTESQIAFRAITRDSSERDFYTPAGLERKILAAWKRRRDAGLRHSFRLFYSEGDGFPGLIIDRYVARGENGEIQILASQVLTAGAEALTRDTGDLLRSAVKAAHARGLSRFTEEQTALILRNDVSVRKHEDLDVEQPRVIRSPRGVEFTNAELLLQRFGSEDALLLNADLIGGQKTGLFLDQAGNIRHVIEWIESSAAFSSSREIRVLDLCCYVGHWSAQLAAYFSAKGKKVVCTQVDVSKTALAFAKKNAERAGGTVETVTGDVLKVLKPRLDEFDVVIADPPAFAKSRKDLPQAEHAYLKSNEQAFRLCRQGGIVVSCSCSGLLSEGNFEIAVGKGMKRSRPDSKRVLRGGPGPDHPTVTGFPEGKYLKMIVHQAGALSASAKQEEIEAEAIALDEYE